MRSQSIFSLSTRSLRSLAPLLLFLTCLFGAPTTYEFPVASVCSIELFAQDDLDLSVLDSNSTDVSTDQETSADASDDLNATSDSNASSRSGNSKTLDLILASGWIGLILLFCSIVAVSLIIRLCLLLRRSVFTPEALAHDLTEAVAGGSYEKARQTAEADASFLGAVAASGLKEVDRGWNAVEKALEDSVAEESAKLYRRTEPLSVIGNVAPMLGLLGTVVGMVETFGELAVADVGGRNLANGIYFALVTTVDGLIVAIPILVAHSLLNSRIASLISAATVSVEKIVEPLKRRALSNVTHANAKAVNNTAAVSTPVGLREVHPDETTTTQTRPTLSLKSRQ